MAGYAYAVMLVKKEGTEELVPLEVSADGTPLAPVPTATKPLEAAVGAGTQTLASITWTGGDLVAPRAIHIETLADNTAAIYVGRVGGSAGISVTATKAVVLEYPDPALWELRVADDGNVLLTAIVPV